MSAHPPPTDTPPGVRAQFGATKDAAWRLAMAHVELAKAEALSIGGQLARVAALAGVAVALLFMAGILAVVGTTLFLADWLFGSMGWGVVHGVLAFTGIAVSALFAAVGLPGRTIARTGLLAFLTAVAVGLILGLELSNRLWTAIGDGLALAVDPALRPLVVGLAVGAVLGLSLGIVAAVRASGGGARAGIAIGLTIVGTLIGGLSAVTFGPRVGVAIGFTVGYATWIMLLALAMYRHGLNMDVLKARFYPTQTIDTSKETLEWLKTRLPHGPGS